MVERGNAVGLTQGDVQRFGDELQGWLVKVSKIFLNRVQGFDKRVAGKPVPPHGSIYDSPPFVVGRERRLLRGSKHDRIAETTA